MSDEKERLKMEPDKSDIVELIPSDLKYEDAFNFKTVLAALFVGFVMLPGSMYMGLLVGTGMGGVAEWVTVILFLEVARRTFVKLKAQELMLIYWAAGGIIGVSGAFGSGLQIFGGSFGLFIWEQYLIQHPLMGELAPKIPDWVVPKVDTGVYALRTFFHSAWMKPVLLGLVVMVLSTINRVTLGYVMFRATADAERLPFPMVNISVGGTMALAESSSGKDGWRWRVFSIGAMVGVLWGFVYAGIPALTSIIAPKPVMFVPIPWIDLSPAIHALLPGAILGISTNLAGVVWGTVIPQTIAWGSVVGSFLGCIVLPPFLVHFGLLPDWKSGFGVIPTSIAKSWDFDIAFGVGVGLVFGWGGLIAMFQNIRKQRKERQKASPTHTDKRTFLRLPPPPDGRGDFSEGLFLILWAASTILLVFLVKFLIPGFPVWITAAFGLIWTPLNSYITARMVGITGSQTGDPFPFLRELTFISSGYRGVALWFAPIPLYNHGWEPWTFRSLELARVKFASYIKLTVLTTTLMIIFSFIYWSLIWKLAPIPSNAYPYAQTMWPMGVQNQYVWLSITDPDSPTRAYFLTRVLNWRVILAGIGVSGVLWGITHAMKLPQLFFFSMIGSLFLWPHYAIPTAIGAIISLRMFKRFGQDKWEAYAPILAAGFTAGMGLIGMIAVAITLMAKAVTPLLY